MRRLLSLGFLFAVLSSIAVSFAAASPADGDSWLAKVAPPALESAAEGPSEFLVFLDRQADLSAAAAIADPLRRRRFVRETLVETAAGTQPPLLAALDRAGVYYRPFWIANVVLVEGDESVLREVAARADVARVDANPRIRLAEPRREKPSAAKAVAGVEWNIDLVGAPEVWAQGVAGQGVVVGGMDTGYQWDHPAIKNQYRGWDGAAADHDYSWHDAVHSGGGACGPDSPEPCDDHGHGTHTMGTIVGDDGQGNRLGMAPQASWIGCRCMDQGVGTPAMYIECLEWMMAPYPVGGTSVEGDPDLAPAVINNSWTCPPEEGCSWDTLQPIVENVRAAGIVVVASAGNAGPNCSTVSNPPAIYDASFSVGATQSTDAIAAFSSRGPVLVDGSGRMKPDISAPGVAVRSCIPTDGYASLSGTSMAGPHVAGLVALMLSAGPLLAGDVDAIESIITATALPLQSDECGDGVAVPNNVFGHGRIDAPAACTQAVVGVGDGTPPAAAAGLLLMPNVPNPFNPRTSIRYFLPAAAAVDLRIFDVSGELVRVLAAGAERSAGTHEAVWDGRDRDGRAAAAGVYFCRLSAAGDVRTITMALVK